MQKKLKPEERKAQVIQTALRLFAVKGYENTTVNNIIDEAGISKGGFYHYYVSKEDLLEDIVRMMVGDMVFFFNEIESRRDLSALEKTNEYIRKMNTYKSDKMVEVASLLAELYSGGKNLQLECKVFDFAKKNVAPIMKKTIFQGVEEGTFHTEFPEEAAETYIRLLTMHQQEISELFYTALREGNEILLETIKNKYRFLQKLLEDTLGLERGSLVVEEVMVETVERMAKKMMAEPEPG